MGGFPCSCGAPNWVNITVEDRKGEGLKHLRKANSFLAQRSPVTVVSVALVIIVAIGVTDYYIGQNFSSALFYVIPVLGVAWYVGLRWGLAISFLSGAGLMLTDWLFRADRHPFIAFWNAVFPFVFFILLVLLISTLKDALARELETSRVDPLIGLYNRRYFDELAGVEIERARRYDHPLSLAFIDVDNFKAVNDTLGHKKGDELLTALAGVFKRDLRSSDQVARFGGDEFVIMLPEAGGTDAARAMSKVKRDVAVTAEGNGWPVTLSMGLVTYKGPPPALDEIVKEADALMYSVKDGGKDNMAQKVITADHSDS